jgi:hypothetical protein
MGFDDALRFLIVSLALVGVMMTIGDPGKGELEYDCLGLDCSQILDPIVGSPVTRSRDPVYYAQLAEYLVRHSIQLTGKMDKVWLVFESFLPLTKFENAAPERYTGSYEDTIHRRGKHIITLITHVRFVVKKFPNTKFFITLATNEADQVIHVFSYCSN